jgi:hypothetical protein
MTWNQQLDYFDKVSNLHTGFPTGFLPVFPMEFLPGFPPDMA